jgi:hypothetical protein
MRAFPPRLFSLGLQEQEHVVLYPLLQVPYGEQDALGLGPGSVPLFAETIGECLFLLRWLQFVREQFYRAAAAQNIKRLVRFLSQPIKPLVPATA